MITYENTKTIADLVGKAGEFFSEKVYLRYEENDVVKEVTYGQFLKYCQAVAGWAEEQSEKQGQKVRVGVLGGSSESYLAVLLGVMANGNVAVPLDVQLNVATLADCADRADLDYLFYDWEHYELVEGAKEQCSKLKGTICLQNRKHVECVQQIWKNYTHGKLKEDINPDECAMLLFTSGTTGKGKGVMLSHGNLIDNVFCSYETRDPDKEVLLNVLPIHHIFCINGDILVTLRWGNVLCLNQDMSKLVNHIQLFQPTFIHMVPMMAKTLYNRIAVLHQQYKDKSLEEIKSLVLGKRLYKVICGGGYLAPDLAQCYKDIGIKIAQGYGMSECSPTIASPEWERMDKVASVGKIVKRCEVRIVDEEIQVKSPSVMMGYYNDPEETKKALTEDGWLCTGDLGYVDEEGFLFFTGRSKNLIILSNGENVAPEQIENLFEDETLIEDILVYGENDRICAEVYPSFQLAEAMGIEDIEQAVADIIKKHNEDLPTFKQILESHVRYVPFEKTSSRKIIRGKYFEQKAKEEKEMENLRMPETEHQKIIYNSVAQSLGHERFGIDTNLYEVGLDSLGSVMLLSDLYEKLKISITLQELSNNATVEKLSDFAKKMTASKVDYTVRDVYPLTALQSYFGYILKGNTTSNLPMLFKLDKSVDLQRLKNAVEQVFEVHVEMKNVIQPQDGVLKNFRDDNKKIDIPVIELSDKEWEEQRKNLIVPFWYTENEPLYHVGIYKTESDNYFFFDLAHIIGDGMSLNVIFEDINALYKGEEVHKQNYTLYEYMLDEADKTARGLRAENIKYFTELTEGLKIRKSILNRKDSYNLEKGVDASIKNRFMSINKKSILAFCHRYGVSENVLFLTAFNYCVSVFANDDDILTTSIHSGRTDSRWNRLVGALFVTYMFRYKRVAHETVPELLKKSAKQILSTMDCYVSNNHVDEMFIQYQGDILNIDELGGAPAERQEMQLDSLPFHFQIYADKKGYFYELRYWENRFDREQLEVFLRCYESIVQAMLVESSVRRVKKYIPECEKPKHFFIEAGKINEEAGYELIPGVAPETKVKAYVLDNSCQKKPFGGWGDLYIMDYPTVNMVDQMENPYGDGTLYQTGLTARITPAGAVELLESTGRKVMLENLRGRTFPDLHEIETVLCGYEGVNKAEAYTCYSDTDNSIHIGADLYGVKEEQIEDIRAYATEHLKEGVALDKMVVVAS